ncbi:MAG: MFS transporter [Oscillospiraceae bacterium]|nr:MFS transporter [Oscillospiraceae bacterium]
MGKKSIFNRYFILLFLTSVCFCTATEMNNVVLPLYVTEDLGGTAATMGILTSIYTAVSALSRPVNGILTDRHRRRNVMLIGCVLYALGIFFCGFIPVLAAAFIARGVQGIGYSAASTANMAASNDVIPHEYLNEGVGYFGISQTLPSLFAPLLATTLVAVIGNRSSQYVTAAFCVAATVLSLFVNYEGKREYASRQSETPREDKGAFIEPTAIPSALIEFGSLFFTTAIMVFIALFFTAGGLSTAMLGAYLTTTGVSILLFRTLLSRFVGKVNPLVLLIPAWLCGIAECLLLPRCRTMLACIAMGILFGAVHGVVWMVNGSLAVHRAAPHRRGAANGTFYLAFDAAIGIAATVWGLCIDAVGYANTYRIAACGYGAMILVALFVYRRWRAAAG